MLKSTFKIANRSGVLLLLPSMLVYW